MATLYIVATPIGNLLDITYRAIEVLKEVSVIACEDTKNTIKLLNHYDIHKTLLSCRQQNEEEASDKVIKTLARGESVAYCSDAGTPGISDPGAVLVHKVRKAGYKVSAIPGASASTAIVSIAGIIGKSFIFEGFLPIKKGRRVKRLEALIAGGVAFILYESPYRVLKLLQEIDDIDSRVQVVIGRELTKLHEEVITGTPKDLIADFNTREVIRGEFVILVSMLEVKEKTTK